MTYDNQYVADIRKRCVIKSGAGNLMIIPRERKLVRVYIQLTPAAATSFKKSHHIDTLLSVAQKILWPYSFHISHIHWSTIYSVRAPSLPLRGWQLLIHIAMFPRLAVVSAAHSQNTIGFSLQVMQFIHTLPKQGRV
jgi:hypothetical protein